MVNFLARKKEENDKKKNIIRNYDSTSNFYDKRYYAIQRQKFDLTLRHFDVKNRLILDAGCGTGLFTEFLLEDIKENVPPYAYVGFDISPKMLSIFNTKLATILNSEKKKIHTILADLENIPIRSDVFDLTISLTALQNLPNLEKGAFELMRVSKTCAEVILSILRKQLDINSIVSKLKKQANVLEVNDDPHIEDIVIRCKPLKI